MDDESGTKKEVNEGRCPTIKEVFGYTAIVILVAAILIPIEFNLGVIGALRSFNITVSEKETIGHFILEKIGVLSVAKNHLFHSKEKGKDKAGKDVSKNKEKVFSKEELKKYSGESDKIYLAFLGKVYDVTKGRKHYGKDGSYSFFSGKDGSRAFVTGEFNEEGLVDNIEGLDPTNYLGLINWQEMYKKDYKYIGKLEGYFYDQHGDPIDGLRVLEEGVKQGKIAKKNEENDKKTFPFCNSNFTPDTGTDVWCSEKSGGISRDWAGVPRKFFKPGQKNHRCACVKEEHLSDPRFQEYAGCPSTSKRCKVKD